MYIQNATYKAVPTDGLTFPLAEGTVLTVGDVTGVVPENIYLAAPTGLIYLAVGGTIDLTSEANSGVTFTDAQIKALSGDFNFIPLAESSGPDVPAFTAADIGKVLMVVDYGDGEERIIVPPQAKFFMGPDPAELADVDLTAFVVGATATLRVAAEDGSVPTTEYSVTCTEGEDDVLTFASESCPVTIFIDNRFVFATSEDEGYLVISLTQVTPNPQLAWVSVENASSSEDAPGEAPGEVVEAGMP